MHGFPWLVQSFSGSCETAIATILRIAKSRPHSLFGTAPTVVPDRPVAGWITDGSRETALRRRRSIRTAAVTCGAVRSSKSYVKRRIRTPISCLWQLPDPHRPVIASCQSRSAIGRERHGVDTHRVAIQPPKLIAVVQIPEPDQSTAPARESLMAVCRERHATHTITFEIDELKLLAGGCIPQAKGLIARTGQNKAVIRRSCDGSNRTRVSLENFESVATRDIPNLHRTGPTSSDQPLPVGRERRRP